MVPGKLFIKGLQDDYVKFFRFAQWKIHQNGSGIMGFITSNSYLDNPTFRGMRYSLLKSFDEIYILDLKGAARKIDKDDEDENVFGVGPGIAIGFFIKLKRPGTIRENLDSLNCRVFYSMMKGSKDNKLKQLEKFKERNIKTMKWERVFPMGKFYLFTPGRKVDIYQHFIKVTGIFPLYKYIFAVEKIKKFNFNHVYQGKSLPRQPNINPSVLFSHDYLKYLVWRICCHPGKKNKLPGTIPFP